MENYCVTCGAVIPEGRQVCPICNREYEGIPALSRTDNETLICPECGTAQALDAMLNGSDIHGKKGVTVKKSNGNVINIDDERHKEIAQYYGNLLEMRKLSEELAELQVEVGVAVRSVPTKPQKNMWSEMADVINCIIHVAIQWGKIDEVLEEINRKLDRQINRIKKEEN